MWPVGKAAFPIGTRFLDMQEQRETGEGAWKDIEFRAIGGIRRPEKRREPKRGPIPKRVAAGFRFSRVQ